MQQSNHIILPKLEVGFSLTRSLIWYREHRIFFSKRKKGSAKERDALQMYWTCNDEDLRLGLIYTSNAIKIFVLEIPAHWYFC